jgi:hypothetical protein
MAVIVNTNTRQNPMLATGLTGTQVIRFIDGPRIYIKAVDTTPTPITIKSNGAIPAGYTDLGIVDGKAKVTYTKSIEEVRTGIDQVLQAEFVNKKTMQMQFGLTQFDDIVLEQLSALTTSVVTTGSAVQFPVGQEDVVQRALLVVLQNKLDGKEWQFYNPNAYITFQYTTQGDYTLVQANADLPLFTWQSSYALCIQTMFA